jgi:hypothetical protein
MVCREETVNAGCGSSKGAHMQARGVPYILPLATARQMRSSSRAPTRQGCGALKRRFHQALRQGPAMAGHRQHLWDKQ